MTGKRSGRAYKIALLTAEQASSEKIIEEVVDVSNIARILKDSAQNKHRE